MNIRVAALGLAVVLAWAAYRLVERPVRLGSIGNAKVFVLVLLMAIVGYVGFNTYSKDGLGFRVQTISRRLRRLQVAVSRLLAALSFKERTFLRKIRELL